MSPPARHRTPSLRVPLSTAPQVPAGGASWDLTPGTTTLVLAP